MIRLVLVGHETLTMVAEMLTVRRWLRLMFTRELPFALALRLWDGIFAEDPGLGIIDHICVAMLLLIRNEREWRSRSQCWRTQQDA